MTDDFRVLLQRITAEAIRVKGVIQCGEMVSASRCETLSYCPCTEAAAAVIEALGITPSQYSYSTERGPVFRLRGLERDENPA